MIDFYDYKINIPVLTAEYREFFVFELYGIIIKSKYQSLMKYYETFYLYFV